MACDDDVFIGFEVCLLVDISVMEEQNVSSISPPVLVSVGQTSFPSFHKFCPFSYIVLASRH